MSLKSAPGTNRMKRRTSDAVAELKGENVDEALKRVNNDSQLRGYALRWGQKGRGGFRCPPQTLLDLPFPSPDDQGCDPGPMGICEADHAAPGPGPQSWSFQGGMGVQRDVGGKSKSPLIPLGPAQRASPEDGHLQSLLVNTCSLMLRKRFMLILSKLRMQKQQPCQTECGGIANRAGVCYDGSNRSLPVRATEEGDKILC